MNLIGRMLLLFLRLLGIRLPSGMKGKRMTPEQRKRMSLAHLGKPLSAAHRAAISRVQLGKHRKCKKCGVPGHQQKTCGRR